MDCRELEGLLEDLLDGRLDEREARRCRRHLAACGRCRELVEPLGEAAAPPAGLLDAVLARTSGPACGRAEELLCGWADGELAGAERRLVAAHLAGCAGCRELAAALGRLAVELPRLAELRPDPGFVDSVLAATLPPSARLRRWWAVTWPRWLRRPRFASETAFVATIALALIFVTPGSPLAAVPDRALELARSDPAAPLERRAAVLGQSLDSRLTGPIRAGYARGEAELRGWAAAAAGRGRETFEEINGWLGTARERLASLLGSAEEKASEEPEETTGPDQETP